MFAGVERPTVFVTGHWGPAVVALREAGTGSAGDQKVEGLVQQDGSNLTRAVECLCLYRTKSCSLHHTAAASQVAKGGNLGLTRSSHHTVEAQT
jgi:hypothetical protein